MVDQERLDRLLDRVASDLKILAGYRAVARAVGFRNVLVHEYIDIDDERVRENLQRLDDLEAFVSHIAAWSGE